MRRFYERHFLGVELGASVVVTGAIVAGSLFGRVHLLCYIAGNRAAIYTSLTAVFGTLLGFVVTGVSVILALTDSPRFKLLRTSPYYKTLFDIYVNAAKFLALATIAAFAGVVLDREASPLPVISYLTLWLVIISSLRLFRCIWVLERLVTVATAIPED